MAVYDLECYPNFFSCCAVSLDRDNYYTWEISERRNDKDALLDWLYYLQEHRAEMIGFNNIGYDYILIHELLRNPPTTTHETLYKKSQQIFDSQKGGNNFGLNIWPNDRFISQIDLFKIWHFDNAARRQSLKGLQFNMRARTVVDLPIKPGTYLTHEQMDLTRAYGQHDVQETKRFALISAPEIELRRKLLDDGMVSGDVLNFNATKIGKELLIQRMGDICWRRDENGRRQPRQTIRAHIPLKDIIFPYIRFNHPEFQRVHAWMLAQTLQPSDIDTERASTKGVFKDVSAIINGFKFDYGTGGIHGSVTSRVFRSDDKHVVRDADVASLYPSIGIVNRISPAHLGEAFVQHYAALKTERFKHPKKSAPNEAFKLGLNGSCGDTNNKYSPLYDPAYNMCTTLNGQLLISMLAEWLMLGIPELEMIQVNTDGITARIPRTACATYDAICKQWEQYTLLELEFVDYKSMWIRDVNNYVALDTKGKLKTKGAYWTPGEGDDYNKDMSGGPGHWHQPINDVVVARAAIGEMVHGVPVELGVMACADPFDFMMVCKATGGASVYIGDQPQQRVTRYYVSRNGAPMVKLFPPVEGSIPGAYKMKTGVSHWEYQKHDPFVWNPAVHTKNQSKYEDRKTSVHAGHVVTECNDMDTFDWGNLNYDFYIAEAKKLVIK